MKKLGFTLAEVLITLGIIGVVAALTAPALVQNAGTAKIGPTLSKVVSTIENANEQILHDEDATNLSKIANTNQEYFELLSKYISGSSYDTEFMNAQKFEPSVKYYDGSDASSIRWDNMGIFSFSDNITLLMGIQPDSNVYEAKGSFKGDYAILYADINGIKTKPNTIGKDIFLLHIDKGGQVLPMGGSTYAWLKNDDNYKYSAKSSKYTCNETAVIQGFGCAGSIFENNFKVIYQ